MNTTKVNLNEYDGKIKVDDYNYIFILGREENFKNIDFVKRLDKYQGTICWMGNGIDKLLKYGNYDLRYTGKSNQITKIKYKEKEYTLEDESTFNLVESLDDNNNILSTITDENLNYPYIIQNKNLFYISKIDLNSILYYIFSDSLNDIFDIRTYSQGQIFFKLNYVQPFTDKKKLKNIADYFYSKSIPFMIDLIPAYRDEKSNKTVTISDDKEFIEVLKYIQDKGGSIVLNGYTHQYKTESTSKENFEFWNKKDNTEIEEDIDVYIKNRILSGLRLCIENEIYPLAFQAPNDAINSNGYKEIKKYFSTYVGSHQDSDNLYGKKIYPYIIKNSNDFNKLIPENLGCINEKEKFYIEKLEENIDRLSIVRGYSLGISFYSDLSIDYLDKIVDKINENDINFIDLKDTRNWIKIDDINIESNNGAIKYNYNKNLAKDIHKQDHTIITQISKFIIMIVFVSIVLFILTFIIFKKIEKNKFFR